MRVSDDHKDDADGLEGVNCAVSFHQNGLRKPSPLLLLPGFGKAAAIGVNDRKEDGQRKYRKNEDEREGSRNVNLRKPDIPAEAGEEAVGTVRKPQDHLYADEEENEADAVLEKREVAVDGSEGEVERAESENGEDIGGNEYEGIARDGEHGGDGVDGKGDVGGLDDDERNEERRGEPPSVLDDEETVAVHFGRDGEEALEDPNEEVALGVRFVIVVVAEHLDGGTDEDDAEEEEDPFEARDDDDAGKDEDAAEDERADDAPEEDFVLVFSLDAEIGKEHEEDEEIVGGE